MTLDWLCGRTFDMGRETFTIVSFTSTAARVHVANGTRQLLPLALLRAGLDAGLVVESLVAPFTHDAPITTPNRNTGAAGVAGRHKRIRSFAELRYGRKP